MTDQARESEQRVFKVKLPMRVKTSSKKKQALNLNVYRNLHHRSLHAQKKMFEKIAKKLLRGIPSLGVITLHYEVCPQSKRRLDIMNIGSIVDKYFSDALTEEGIIEDDDFYHIPEVSFTFGGLVSKEYVLVTITEIKPRSTPMRVLLDDMDIQKALTTYVSTLNIPNATGAKLEMLANGTIEAEVTFDSTAVDPLALNTEEHNPPEPDSEFDNEPPKRRKRRTKAEMEAAREAENVDTTVQAGADISGEGASETSGDEDTPTDTATDVPKATKKGNLFGDKETPSSEDDGPPEAETPPNAPVKTKGSIFDS